MFSVKCHAIYSLGLGLGITGLGLEITVLGLATAGTDVLGDIFKSTSAVRMHLKLLVRLASRIIKGHLGPVLVPASTK